MGEPCIIEFNLLAKARLSREFGGNRERGNTLESTLSDEDAKDLSHLRLQGTRVKEI